MKALAETAALLVLRKKPKKSWGLSPDSKKLHVTKFEIELLEKFDEFNSK